MSLPNLSELTAPPAPTKQQERAQRIMDAAAELILRWGYDKTTVDDIAQKAGVAKGTIYLHWKTREELFEALIKRETVALSDDYRRRIAVDPEGATLRGIYKHAALALIRRPLLKAFVLQDREIIGKMARSRQGVADFSERLSGFKIYLEFMSQHGLVRPDINFKAQVYTVTSIFMGFFLLIPMVPDELRLTDEEVAEMIGESIHRTLESERPIGAEEMASLSSAFLAYLDKIAASAQEQVQRATEFSD